MRTIKVVTAWVVTSILFIITLPISILIYGVSSNEYFWSDYYEGKPPPKYFIKWFQFVLSPFKLL
jgi:hypothetical protein